MKKLLLLFTLLVCVRLTTFQLDFLSKPDNYLELAYPSGQTLATAFADIDNDGYSDLVFANKDLAEIVILWGDSTTNLNSKLSSIVTTGDNFSQTQGFKLKDSSNTNKYAYTVSVGGDINGDGFKDILIGRALCVYIIYGGSKKDMYSRFGPTYTLTSSTSLPQEQGIIFSAQGSTSSVYFGWAATILPDINNDGFDDFAILAGYPGGAPSIQMFILYGSSVSNMYARFGDGLAVFNPSVPQLPKIAQGFAFVLDYYNIGSNQYSVITAGDFNGDGYNDFAIGVSNLNVNKVVVLFGSSSPTEFYNLHKGSLYATNPWRDLTGTNPGMFNNGQAFTSTKYKIGDIITSIGDFSRDGFSDIMITVYSNTMTDRGRGVFLIFGFKTPTNTAISVDPTNVVNNQILALYLTGIFASFSSAGDINQDGYNDVIICQDSSCTVIYSFDTKGDTTTYNSLYYKYLTPYIESNLAFMIAGSTLNLNTVASAGDVNNDGYQDLFVGRHLFLTFCNSGYHINSQSICQKCPLSGCVNCNKNENVCYYCQTGYSLRSGGCNACSAAQFSFGGKTSACSDCPEGCASCTDSFTCQTCNSNWILPSGTTLCTQCLQGTYSAAGTDNTCQKCPDGCITCTSANSCGSCNYRMFLSSSTRICESCPEGCLTCTSDTSGTSGISCQACNYGMFVSTITKVCQTCPTGCTSCTSEYTCLTCEDHMYVSDAGICKTCPEGCTSCNSATSCQISENYGYYLSPASVSLPCPEGSYCSSGQMRNCPSTYTSKQKSSSINDCSCPSGTYLSAGGNCTSIAMTVVVVLLTSIATITVLALYFYKKKLDSKRYRQTAIAKNLLYLDESINELYKSYVVHPEESKEASQDEIRKKNKAFLYKTFLQDVGPQDHINLFLALKLVEFHGAQRNFVKDLRSNIKSRKREMMEQDNRPFYRNNPQLYDYAEKKFDPFINTPDESKTTLLTKIYGPINNQTEVEYFKSYVKDAHLCMEEFKKDLQDLINEVYSTEAASTQLQVSVKELDRIKEKLDEARAQRGSQVPVDKIYDILRARFLLSPKKLQEDELTKTCPLYQNFTKKMAASNGKFRIFRSKNKLSELNQIFLNIVYTPTSSNKKFITELQIIFEDSYYELTKNHKVYDYNRILGSGQSDKDLDKDFAAVISLVSRNDAVKNIQKSFTKIEDLAFTNFEKLKNKAGSAGEIPMFQSFFVKDSSPWFFTTRFSTYTLSSKLSNFLKKKRVNFKGNDADFQIHHVPEYNHVNKNRFEGQGHYKNEECSVRGYAYAKGFELQICPSIGQPVNVLVRKTLSGVEWCNLDKGVVSPVSLSYDNSVTNGEAAYRKLATKEGSVSPHPLTPLTSA